MAGLVLVAGTCAGVDLVRTESSSELEFVTQCGGKRECSFQDQMGTNRYVVKKNRLTRFESGSKVGKANLTGKWEEVVLSTISSDRRQLAVAIERAAMTRSSRRIGTGGAGSMMGGMMSGGGALDSPPPSMEGADGADIDGLHRQYRCEIINPKSCEIDKSINLGAFWVKSIALSDGGEYLLAYGEDLQIHQSQVRVFNTRSGKMEAGQALPKNPNVRLASNGFVVNGEAWKLRASTTVAGAKRFVTERFGSIAEYDVKCPQLLLPADYKGQSLAVVEVSNADDQMNQMLTASLTTRLAGAGFDMVERQEMKRILEELSFQASGFTVEDKAADIGEMANANFLIVGALQQVGTTAALNLRVVGVEDARVHAAAEVVCYDCEIEDYREGMAYLVSAWVGER
jgi:hypothetical protein